ncbi:Acg family FMN-binding oxidoreductase [Flavobacterium anhuiense]|uniref:Acg family FMN-binding oxidoreductase n=1 Tax=Flavobacterium anhuiense TaxID=459526 RepID=UPI000E6BE239|nr:hypothetical protein [Flavobacterium anhuiense]
MKRRTFLYQSGAFITSTALISLLPQKISAFDKTSEPDDRRDDYKIFPEPIMQAIAIGLNAPNAHNTQAWKFKIINDKEALVYIDNANVLPETDPPRRQIHISAGCLLEAINIGSTGIGYKTEINLFPNGNYKFEDIGTESIASVKLVSSDSISKHVHWDFIFQRRTSRMVYNGEMITQNEFDQIEKATLTENSRLLFIHDPQAMELYTSIFSKAMKTEFNTLATNEETRKNFRFTDNEASEKRDGLTFEANGFKGMQKLFAKTFTKNTLEGWNKPSIIEKGFSHFEKGLNSAKGFVLWITDKNDYKNHVEVGRDFYRFCLALTAKNIYMHPLTQATQEYKEMDGIRQELNNLVGVQNNEKIQMIVRIGRSEVPFESFRRHVKDVVYK